MPHHRSFIVVLFTAASLATIGLYIPSSYTVYAKSPTELTIETADARLTTAEIPSSPQESEIKGEEVVKVDTPTTSRLVPFYSQFSDITAQEWRKIGCGIASLAMLIDYYQPAVNVDTLLSEGIESGAYTGDAGWSHSGLIALARDHGLKGEAHYLTDETMADAFLVLATAVETGPVMVSVHYTFEPTNPIPHIVVVTDIDETSVHYNDPAEKTGGGVISIQKFKKSWKKRYIEIRPTT